MNYLELVPILGFLVEKLYLVPRKIKVTYNELK